MHVDLEFECDYHWRCGWQVCAYELIEPKHYRLWIGKGRTVWLAVRDAFYTADWAGWI